MNDLKLLTYSNISIVDNKIIIEYNYCENISHEDIGIIVEEKINFNDKFVFLSNEVIYEELDFLIINQIEVALTRLIREIILNHWFQIVPSKETLDMIRKDIQANVINIKLPVTMDIVQGFIIAINPAIMFLKQIKKLPVYNELSVKSTIEDSSKELENFLIWLNIKE